MQVLLGPVVEPAGLSIVGQPQQQGSPEKRRKVLL